MAELLEHQHERIVADDRVLVLQVVDAGPGPWPPGARGSPPSTAWRPSLPPYLLGPGEALSGRPRRPACAPWRSSSSHSSSGQAVIVPVGARILAAVVEEADRCRPASSQRLDLGSMKRVERRRDRPSVRAVAQNLARSFRAMSRAGTGAAIPMSRLAILSGSHLPRRCGARGRFRVRNGAHGAGRPISRSAG